MSAFPELWHRTGTSDDVSFQPCRSRTKCWMDFTLWRMCLREWLTSDFRSCRSDKGTPSVLDSFHQIFLKYHFLKCYLFVILKFISFASEKTKKDSESDPTVQTLVALRSTKSVSDSGLHRTVVWVRFDPSGQKPNQTKSNMIWPVTSFLCIG